MHREWFSRSTSTRSDACARSVQRPPPGKTGSHAALMDMRKKRDRDSTRCKFLRIYNDPSTSVKDGCFSTERDCDIITLLCSCQMECFFYIKPDRKLSSRFDHRCNVSQMIVRSWQGLWNSTRMNSTVLTSIDTVSKVTDFDSQLEGLSLDPMNDDPYIDEDGNFPGNEELVSGTDDDLAIDDKEYHEAVLRLSRLQETFMKELGVARGFDPASCPNSVRQATRVPGSRPDSASVQNRQVARPGPRHQRCEENRRRWTTCTTLVATAIPSKVEDVFCSLWRFIEQRKSVSRAVRPIIGNT